MEFLQEAQKYAIQLVNRLNTFPDVDSMFQPEYELSPKDRQAFVRLISGCRVGADSLADSVSVAVEAITVDPANWLPVQAACDQAMSELNLLNGLIEKARNTEQSENIDDKVKCNEPIQEAQGLILYLLTRINALSNRESTLSSNPQLDPREQEATLISQCREARADTERTVESISGILKAIAFDPEQPHLLQETPFNLVLPVLSKHQEVLASLGSLGNAIAYHYFTAMLTRIRDLEILKLSLEQLGLTGALDADVRGWNSQKVKADVVAVLQGNCDIGWRRRADGSVEMVADLWGVAQSYNPTELINSIWQQYAKNVSSG